MIVVNSCFWLLGEAGGNTIGISKRSVTRRDKCGGVFGWAMRGGEVKDAEKKRE